MRKLIIGLAVSGPALAAIAGCGSSAATQTSGTEHFAGTLTGPAAMASAPAFHLRFSGPVSATATQTLAGAAPTQGQTFIFPTSAGKLAVEVTKDPVTRQALVSPATCAAQSATTVPYKIDGSKSTGKWAGATGSGTVDVVFKGNLPKRANGTCNTSSTASPEPGTASSSFTGGGPVTVLS